MRVDENRLTAAYLMASRKYGTLYVGSALDLLERVWRHKEGQGSRFTTKYGVKLLVWYEPFMLLSEAREREYEIKKWQRDWKTNLIERDNPNWDDLYWGLTGTTPLPR